MISNIAIGNASLQVEVSPLGAELRSLKTAEGSQLLWQGDDVHWPQRSPLLFPVIGLPRDGQVWFDGRPYPIDRHGFAHGLVFQVIEQTGTSMRLQARQDSQTKSSFPYDFRLVVDYSVFASSLSIAVTVINDEIERTMPFCIGFHPGFVWPLPGNINKADHIIDVLSKATMKERRIYAGTLMGLASKKHGRSLHLELEESSFIPSAIILEDTRPGSVSYRGPAGPTITIVASDNLPNLGVWSKGKGEYVCIEPWSAMPQSEDYFGALSDQPGATNLAAGAETTFSITVSVTPIS